MHFVNPPDNYLSEKLIPGRKIIVNTPGTSNSTRPGTVFSEE
jgi:hypothetical protein